MIPKTFASLVLLTLGALLLLAGCSSEEDSYQPNAQELIRAIETGMEGAREITEFGTEADAALVELYFKTMNESQEEQMAEGGATLAALGGVMGLCMLFDDAAKNGESESFRRAAEEARIELWSAMGTDLREFLNRRDSLTCPNGVK